MLDCLAHAKCPICRAAWSGTAGYSQAPSDIILADEPTGNLDPDLSLEVMNIFKRFNEVGVTVLIASHDIHLIERFGVRRVILAQGRTVDSWDAHPDSALPEIRADRS